MPETRLNEKPEGFDKNVMRLQSASEVFNKTEFNNQSDWDTYPTADYCCDKCNQMVSIDLKSLTKHQFSDFSNLDSVDKKGFEELEIKCNISNSFLDFYCPTCKRPVKVYYDSWAGGHHGEMGFTIKFVGH